MSTTFKQFTIKIKSWRPTYYFNCYSGVPRSTLEHYRGGILTHPMLINAFLYFWPEGQREPRNVLSLWSAPYLQCIGYKWSQLNIQISIFVFQNLVKYIHFFPSVNIQFLSDLTFRPRNQYSESTCLFSNFLEKSAVAKG